MVPGSTRPLGRTPFGTYARAWQQAQVHRGTTADQVASNLRNHILPAFEGRAIASVRRSEVQAWVRDRSDVLAPATVEVVYRYLAAIFAAAVRDRLIARSPCVGIKLPRPAPSELRPATTEEVLAIAEAVPRRYRALVLLTGGTGLRQGEAFGVILPNVDLDRAELRVDRQVVLRAGRPPEFAPPKTDASVRTIPLPAGVTAVLLDHLADFPATVQLSLGRPVFSTPAGELIRRNRFGEVWRGAIRRSGVRPDLTFHDLRHYYASLLIRHGESVKVVQRASGTRRPRRRSTPTVTSGPIPTVGPARRSTASCSARTRPGPPSTTTHRESRGLAGLERGSNGKTAGQQGW